MIQVAVVDDDLNYCHEYIEYIQRYAKEHREAISVQEFHDGEDILDNYNAKFDIILMDIDMRFVNGMDAAAKIRENDSKVIIIFMTNLPQYAMEGYKVDALDYVLKPVNYSDFSQRLTRAISKMQRRQTKYFLVPVRGGASRIDLARLMYVEVQNHDLIYHMSEENIQTRGTMRDVESRLTEEGFFRCSNCYLVNLAYVEGIVGNDIQIGNSVIAVSRSRRKELLNALNNYFSEVAE